MRRIPEEFGIMLGCLEWVIIITLLILFVIAGIFIVESFEGILW